jgi:PAS domain S-box-containing protein
MSNDDPGEHVQALERKLAELEERDQQFRSFMSNIPGACYRTDARSHATVFLSEQIADICGYSVAEFMAPGGPTCYGLIHPDDRERADRIYAAALARRAPFEVEMRFRHKDGGYRWVLERGRGAFGADGKVDFYDGVFVDITERHAILDRLHDSERQFKTLIQNIPGSCYRASAGAPYHLEYLSDTFTEVTGYPVSEFVGADRKSDVELIVEEDRDLVRSTIDEALAARRPFSMEYRIRHKDGSIRWMLEQGRGVFDEAGTLLHVDGVVFDVTDRVKAGERAKLLETAIECSDDAIEISDADFRIRYVNPAFERMTGLAATDVRGKTSDVLLRDGENANIGEALKAGKVWQGELIARHKDGGIIHQDAIISPIRDRTGAVVSYIAVKRDVTERRRMEKDLRQALDRANAAMDKLAQQERMATIGKVAATVSHELRNPLTAILTSTALLRRRAEADVVRTLDRIERNVERCTDIITDLLAFTEPEALQRDPTAVDDWLATLLDQHRLPDGIALARQLSCPGIAAIDRRLLGLAIGNLVENAAAALRDPSWQPPPGHRPAIVVRSESVGANCLITITDNGPGLGADVMPRAFEPLFTTRGFGVGLGLPIARQIVQQHGGSLTLHNGDAGGAVAIISLPRQTSAQAAA